MRKGKKYTREFLITELQRLAKELGHSPKFNELRGTNIGPDANIYVKVFGTWNAAKEAAGVQQVHPPCITCGADMVGRYFEASFCLVCAKKRIDVRRKERRRTRRKNDPSFREKENRLHREYYYRYREREIEKSKKWNREHPERKRANRRRNYLENIERYLAQSMKWRSKNLEYHRKLSRDYHRKYAEEMREKGKQWYYANKDKAFERHRRWYHKNKEKAHAWLRRWRNTAEGRVRVRLLNAKRRALEKAQYAKIEPKEILALMKQYNACFYCGKAGNLSLDHVIPLSKGGLNHHSNLVLACHSCNSSKKNKSLDAWFKIYPEKETHFYRVMGMIKTKK
jgi:5-methylcytosine-specific restriction endonuclease McrA